MSESTVCNHAEEMARKSEVITMSVVMKKKYAEFVDVLDQLEKWTHEILYMQLLDCADQILNPVMIAPPQLEPPSDQTNLLHISLQLLLTVIHCVV